MNHVLVPEAYRGLDLFLDLGMMDDADATFVNGRSAGGKRDFNNQTLSAWNQHRRYAVPARNVKCGHPNSIAIVVKNLTGLGGLLGQPFIGASLLSAPKARFAAADLPAEQVAQSAFCHASDGIGQVPPWHKIVVVPSGGNVHDAETTAVHGAGEGGDPAAALPGERAGLRPL